MSKDLGLNSTALKTLAKDMREKNEEPRFEMNYSEYAAASGIYAVIQSLESLAVGLEAEERRIADQQHKENQRQMHWMRMVNDEAYLNEYMESDLSEDEFIKKHYIN